MNLQRGQNVRGCYGCGISSCQLSFGSTIRCKKTVCTEAFNMANQVATVLKSETINLFGP